MGRGGRSDEAAGMRRATARTDDGDVSVPPSVSEDAEMDGGARSGSAARGWRGATVDGLARAPPPPYFLGGIL
jgi:hypothetical protein